MNDILCVNYNLSAVFPLRLSRLCVRTPAVRTLMMTTSRSALLLYNLFRHGRKLQPTKRPSRCAFTLLSLCFVLQAEYDAMIQQFAGEGIPLVASAVPADSFAPFLNDLLPLIMAKAVSVAVCCSVRL